MTGRGDGERSGGTRPESASRHDSAPNSGLDRGNGGARPSTGRCLVLHPMLKSEAAGNGRVPEASLEEATGLARAIDLTIAHGEVIKLARLRPSTLLGSGAVERFAELIEAMEIEIVVVDAVLSPVQQRNLERAWKAKVIDRTGLILEIFGARARTREGQLQVELAALSYQRSRLVRSWTHLERQRGGFGFLGGPGESQLEMDRRLIGERIVKLKGELEDVKRTRALHRKARKRVPYPVVALVGYTNAGKSTLFNRFTRSEVLAQDMLFATLDPTMRQVKLPSGHRVILSDTVGFISDLPTHLVAAFRATLEEVLEADIVIHVRDVSHPDTEAQKQDVEGVLRELGLGTLIDAGEDHGIIEARNKIDLLGAEERVRVANEAARQPGAIALSAVTGEGCDRLLNLLDRRLAQSRQVVELAVDLTDGAGIAWLYQHGEVLARRDDDSKAHIRVGLSNADLARFGTRKAPVS